MNKSEFGLTRRQTLMLLGAVAGTRVCPSWAGELDGIAPQPYFAGVNRAIAALAKLGAPLAVADAAQIAVLSRQNDHAAVEAAEKILDRYTLARVKAEANGYARTVAGGSSRTLVEQGWRLFLVRVSNPLGSMGKLNSVPGWPITAHSTGASRAGVPDALTMAPYVAMNWLAAQLYEAVPMMPTLSGFAIEYQVIQLYSRDRGPHTIELTFYTATFELDAFAAYSVTKTRHRGVNLNFDCLPSRDVTLRVFDTNGRGCTASLTIKDQFDRVYPLQAMRLAPDMQFHPQIYRADGETVRLPDGEYTVESKRGPEYLRDVQTVAIGNERGQIEVRLKRWIDPAQWGWYSGDTHIHASGCAHYEHPTEGVSPETMIRHVRGEGLSIGDMLTWGPSWYYQKQFFTGHTASPAATLEHPDLQAASNTTLQPRATPEDGESLLRYDVEVSGFPSSHCGHLVLLRLKDQDYPGTKIIQEWPSWNLPILQWARAQGAVAGYAHGSGGMVVESTDLPNYEIPPMNGTGTQEAIVDVTHGIVDFLSGCQGQPTAELNAWYHLLNCGFRLAMVGGTDWPCASDERVGRGRTYVRLDQRPEDDAGYDAWVRNLQKGRLYCGDGRSHFLEFKVQGRASGDDDVELAAPGAIEIKAAVAARLDPEPLAETDTKTIQKVTLFGPLWQIEHARIGNTREVAVELVVNGVAVDRTAILADGTPRPVHFRTAIARSSWVALRILPSGHTHPVFVKVAHKPIRASKRSAQWCRACVDKLWEVKSPFMRESERPAAGEAYDHARQAYDTIIVECEVD